MSYTYYKGAKKNSGEYYVRDKKANSFILNELDEIMALRRKAHQAELKRFRGILESVSETHDQCRRFIDYGDDYGGYDIEDFQGALLEIGTNLGKVDSALRGVSFDKDSEYLLLKKKLSEFQAVNQKLKQDLTKLR